MFVKLDFPFSVSMEPKRNIFLEAAMKGSPVVLDPSKPVPPKTEQNCKDDREVEIIEQAVKNVGRMPARVLRYVQLMAYNLPEKLKIYYTNVGNTDGPKRSTALKRISRKIAAIDKAKKNSETRATVTPSTSGLNPEDLYDSASEAESDVDRLYIAKPKQSSSKTGKWLQKVEREEKKRSVAEDISDSDDDAVKQKKIKGKKSKKRKLDDVLSMLPDMMASVKEAADAHKEAVKIWQNIESSSDSH